MVIGLRSHALCVTPFTVRLNVYCLHIIVVCGTGCTIHYDRTSNWAFHYETQIPWRSTSSIRYVMPRSHLRSDHPDRTRSCDPPQSALRSGSVWSGLPWSVALRATTLKNFHLPDFRVEVEKSGGREVIVIEIEIQRVAIVHTRVQGLVDPVQNEKRSGKTF